MSLFLPAVIQGGMGAGVSSWTLARAVSQAGQLGVVAGTALDVILARRLELGDPGGHMRRALAQLPLPGVAERVLERFFLQGGKPSSAPFKSLPLLDAEPSRERLELIVAANFVEVFLAKEGHDHPVGINFLEKIQLPTLPSLFGAMLAGVSHVLMGAGIPRFIPSALDSLAEGLPVKLPLDVRGAKRGREHLLRFDPRQLTDGEVLRLERPAFFAIVSSATVANVLTRKTNGRVDGLIVEGSSAGGHNAPPRGALRLDEAGEPIFGERDVPDLEAIARLGAPFWLAGSYASPEGLQLAREHGAMGVQVGTAFAFCRESGLRPDLKRRVFEGLRSGDARVLTDPLASPTGFPFKVLQLAGTLSEERVFEEREKVCDLGYLRHAYARDDGKLGWRCPGEPENGFIHKGGKREAIAGRKCVCNGLLANIGLEQVRRDGRSELPLLTSGAELSLVESVLETRGPRYSAADVLDRILAPTA